MEKNKRESSKSRNVNKTKSSDGKVKWKITEKGVLTIWERYLTAEIGIEFKACLYFFCILFFYCMYRVISGSWDASIVHMTEMILLAYAMGYVQVYLLDTFDEGEQLRVRESFYLILCSGIYTVCSWFGNWFEKNAAVSAGFFVYMVTAYLCAFLVYKYKREVDGKLLNNDLRMFQERKSYMDLKPKSREDGCRKGAENEE